MHSAWPMALAVLAYLQTDVDMWMSLWSWRGTRGDGELRLVAMVALIMKATPKFFHLNVQTLRHVQLKKT